MNRSETHKSKRQGKTSGKEKAVLAVAAVLVLICVIVYGIKFYAGDQGNGRGKDKEPMAPVELSAWLVDWQWQTGLEDLQAIYPSLNSLQVFAAYFDHTDSLYFTEAFNQAQPLISETRSQMGAAKRYLTLVNDRYDQNGKAVQKDSALITRLMSTTESRKRHIDEILARADTDGYDGIEIDYEKIADDDWEQVLLFYAELYQRLDVIGKSLRIVLEPRTPINKLSLPEGPSYVMMAYNLYGTHSGPGPKADHAFIAELADRMDPIPGEPYIAFALGGFEWNKDGKAAALTEKQAAELSQKSLDSPQRDTASGSVRFSYMAEDKSKHTVWYADDITLAGWIETARQAGYSNIALWRLGGMQDGMLEYLKRLE
ncbi:glycosyl hydrolase family 18 protein [Paenibacillus eucommiae]|uniref:Spore germination protein YaaH n=1 Tax=Paenibacillus eucommiae TaxID=1355755 RepID=A0ABS4IW51_9BACL|nr:glycosyl hydrolase family 18 protein [Paenibacillus eucommiae]MBP1991823.1 spore germination protein YaaH [Paenibacillus eucommiae]